MSWTDNKEKMMIKDICDNLSCVERVGQRDSFLNGDYLSVFRTEGICEYNMSTPVEIEDALHKIWDNRRTPEMHGLAKVCTVAMMKNKKNGLEDNSKRQKKRHISEYVYEF